jgi:hypothetical protein
MRPIGRSRARTNSRPCDTLSIPQISNVQYDLLSLAAPQILLDLSLPGLRIPIAIVHRTFEHSPTLLHVMARKRTISTSMLI